MAINDPAALLKRLLAQSGEAEWLEFKQNNCDPEMIGRTVSALANAAIMAGRDHAFMVWGVEDKTKNLVGTNIKLKEICKGGENLENWLSRLMDPKLYIEFVDFQLEEKNYSIICIETSYDRPVRFSGSEYIRIGENVRPLKEFPNHERSLWMATGRRTFEDAIAISNQSVDDIFQKLDVSAYYELRDEVTPRKKSEVIRKFKSIYCITEDMEGGYNITNLGAILFARDISIFPTVSHKAVRLIKYIGLDKKDSEEEVEGKKGYAVGFQGLINYIIHKVPKKEVYIGGIRKSQSVYSEIAIREILANALIHQDFTIIGSGPVVEIYENRIEVTNPGNSLIEIDRIIDERRSRNEKLARAMRDMGICEERGGGIDKAILDIEEKYLPAPEFIPSEHSMRAVMFGPKEFRELSKSEKVWACFCHCVIRWIRHDYMSNTTLRERFGLDEGDYQSASAIIRASKEAGKIIDAEEKQGNRNAKYIPYWAR